jgi:uncharacterized membrane protein YccC
MVLFLATHPWIDAAVQGALIGLFGAALFISISSILLFIDKERRSRQAIARCIEANDRVLQDLLARPGTPVPQPVSSVDRARLAFWTSRRVLESSLWATQPDEARPKPN